MEKKDMNKVVIAVVAVALIIAIIGGSTFAYWQWVTSDAQQTLVNVTVQDGISMTIAPTTTQTNILYPITRANCATASISGQADVEVVNNTGVEARPQFYLKLKILDKNGNNITTTYAQYINFAVAEYYTLDADGNETATPSSYTCANAPRTGAFTTKASYDHNTLETVEGWYDSPILTHLTGTGTDEIASTRFPILSIEEGNYDDSITFKVPANTTKTHKFKFWAWIDSSYSTTNTGEEITDTLQDAKITISWSESSIVKQVTG